MAMTKLGAEGVVGYYLVWGMEIAEQIDTDLQRLLIFLGHTNTPCLILDVSQ